MKYDAFISYSHSADGQLAPAVQSGLQRLAKPWYRRRALRVFRDETGLAVDPQMWSSITGAMDQSRYFVLLASPEAAASPSVGREVTHWLQSHPPETLLPVLTDGTLVWSAARGDYAPDQSSALPPALHGVYTAEPRHLDLRWAHDEDQLDLRHSRFRAQLAILAAAIHGIAPEDLEGEDVRLHRRAMRLAVGVIAGLAALTIAALFATGLAVSYAATARDNEAEAIRNAQEASTQRARALTNAQRARLQKRTAQTNADRAARNQTAAEQQQALAQANATEAQNNADEAAANGAEAQANADRAAANATEARANATEAQANAAAAHRAAQEAQDSAVQAAANATRADANAAQAQAEQQRAESNAIVSLSRQVAATSRNNLEANYPLALLQAVTSHLISPTSQARDSLVRALLARPEVKSQFRIRQSIEGLWVSPTGGTIVVSSFRPGLQLWDAATGRLRATSLKGRSISDAAFGSEEHVAVAFSDAEYRHHVAVVNPTTGDLELHIPYPGRTVEALALSSDGKSLAVRWRDVEDSGNGIDLWDLTGTPALLDTIAERSAELCRTAEHGMVFSSDARTLAWTELDCTNAPYRHLAFVQHLDQNREVGPIELAGDPVALVLSSDGRTLEIAQNVAADGDRGDVEFWDTGTSARVHVLALDAGEVVAASSDQRLIAVRSENNGISTLDARTGSAVGATVFGDSHSYLARITRGGRGLVTVQSGIGTSEEDVSVIDFDAPLRQLGVRQLSRLPHGFKTELSPDGKLVAILHDNGGVSIVDALHGDVISEYSEVPGDLGYSYGRFAPDNSAFLLHTAQGARLLDLRNGGSRVLPLGSSASFDFSPDGRTLAVVSDRGRGTAGYDLRLWDVPMAVPSDAAPPALTGTPNGSIAYSPDGTLAISTSDDGEALQQIEIFPPGQPPRILPLRALVSRFSHDGKELWVWIGGREVLLSMPDGSRIGILRFPDLRDTEIQSWAWDSRAGIAALGNRSGTVQLWDLASGTPIGPPLTGHTKPVTALEFVAPGELVTAAAGDGVIHWQLSDSSLLRRACVRANRDLTRSEWVQIVGGAQPFSSPCAQYLSG